MNNEKKKDYKKYKKRIIGKRNLNSATNAVNCLRAAASTAVPEAYYDRINSKRAVTKHHPVWEGLNEVLVIKGGRVCIR